MAIDVSAIASVVGIETIFENLRVGQTVFLPQRIAVVGQGASATTYSTTKRQILSADEVATTYGAGSPLHLAVLQLLPKNGDGVGTIPVTVYPLQDDASGVPAAGDITPAGTVTAAGAFRVKVNNIASLPFVISVGDAVADIIDSMVTAINGVLEMPIIAVDSTTTLDFTAKWDGTSGNDIQVEIEGPTNIGVSFTITQATGGLVNPDVTTALNQIGNVWETMVLNCLDIADTTALNTYQTFGNGRWGDIIHKPLVVFTGNTAATVSAATAISSVRTTDRINSQLVSPGSNDLPLQVAARQLARIATVANNNPPEGYKSQKATGLTPGADGDQWLYNERDAAVKAGSSTIEVIDGVVSLADVITFYNPTSDPQAPYRFVDAIVRLQNIIFNIQLIFEAPDWAGAPLIPDSQPTRNPAAKQPRSAKAVLRTLIDNLALDAILSLPDLAKSGTNAVISNQNHRRLDVTFLAPLSGNTDIISTTLKFGFVFGSLAA